MGDKMETKLVQAKIEKNLKEEAQDVLDKIGLDMATAIRIYLRQIVNEQAIPFKLEAQKEPVALVFNPEKTTRQKVKVVNGKVVMEKTTLSEAEKTWLGEG